MAKLYFRYGAMNSGKSTLLMQVAYNYEERGMKVLVMKPSIDAKGGDEIVSRLGVRRKVDQLILPNSNVYELVKNKIKDKRPACILVDEAQFLRPEQVDQLFMLVLKDNLPVICYGLRTDFMAKGFPGSKRLLELAHSLEELKTICRCGKKAVLNLRKINGIPTFEGNQVAIDGMDKVEYESVCGNCYLDELKKAGIKYSDTF